METPKTKQKNYLGFLLLLVMIVVLPVAVAMLKWDKAPWDLRPRALTGQANLLLSADTTTTDINGQIVVLISAQLSDAALHMSGADITVLYDKNLLEVVEALPNTTAQVAGAPFTDAPIVNPAVNVDAQFNGVRIAEIANKPSPELASGTINLGKITFRAKAQGAAVIKFPADTSTMEITGIRL